MHLPCHARAQNIGAKAAEMLRFIPKIKMHLIARCSGHGGVWGVMKDHHDTALKMGKPVVKQAIKAVEKNHMIVSECPLAATHIQEGIHLEGQKI